MKMSSVTEFISIYSATTTATATPGEFTDEELLLKLNSEMRDAVQWVTIYVGIEAVLGFFGNLFVLYVFLFHYHVCSFRYFVLCLAFVDFLSCVTTVPGEIITQMYWYRYPNRYLCKVKSFFNVFTVTAEAFCLFTIAVDRYRKICHPFGKQITPFKAKVLCIVIYLSAFLLSIPTPIFWGTFTAIKPYMGRNITVTVCEKDQEFVNSLAPLEYITASEAIVGFILTLMFILYALVARRLIIDKATPTSHRREPTEVGGPEASSTDCISSTDTKTPANSTEQTANVLENRPYLNAVHEMSDASGTFDFKGPKPETLRRQNKPEKAIPIKQVTVRVRRKTKIMLFLTFSFFITSILYLTLLDIIARQGEELEGLTFRQKAVYFFFFRFVFINHVINPWIYGFWDKRFQKAIKDMKHRFVQAFCKGSMPHQVS